MTVDEKALSSAMEAYSPQVQGQPDRERLSRAIAAYLQALRPGYTGEDEGFVFVPKQALSKVLENVAQDEGPYDEGWKSDELQDAVDQLERAMLAAAGGENG